MITLVAYSKHQMVTYLTAVAGFYGIIIEELGGWFKAMFRFRNKKNGAEK